jgi:hypothetical protein
MLLYIVTATAVASIVASAVCWALSYPENRAVIRHCMAPDQVQRTAARFRSRRPKPKIRRDRGIVPVSRRY